MEEEVGSKRERSSSINATGVHTGVKSRCGLSTLLSESLGKPRGLFLIILSLTIFRCIH